MGKKKKFKKSSKTKGNSRLRSKFDKPAKAKV